MYQLSHLPPEAPKILEVYRYAFQTLLTFIVRQMRIVLASFTLKIKKRNRGVALIKVGTWFAFSAKEELKIPCFSR